MSLIHEALEKLEQEKKENVSVPFKPAPPFPGAREIKKEVSRSENPPLIYGVIGVLFLLFIFGLIYFLSSSRSFRSREVPQGKESQPVPSRSFGYPAPFTLTGITRLEEGWTAVINNQMVRTGDEVGGAKVLAVHEGDVVLDVKGRSVTLSLHGEKI